MTILGVRVSVSAEEGSELLRFIDGRISKALAEALHPFHGLEAQLGELRHASRWCREQFDVVEADMHKGLAAAEKFSRDNFDQAIGVANTAMSTASEAAGAAREAMGAAREAMGIAERSMGAASNAVGACASKALQEDLDELRAFCRQLDCSLEDSVMDSQRLYKTVDRAAAESTAATQAMHSMQASHSRIANAMETNATTIAAMQGRGSQLQEQLDHTIKAFSDVEQALRSKAAIEELAVVEPRLQKRIDHLDEVVKTKVSLEHFDEAIECLRASQGSVVEGLRASQDQRDRVSEVHVHLLQERLEDMESAVTDKASRREMLDLFNHMTDRSASALLGSVGDLAAGDVRSPGTSYQGGGASGWTDGAAFDDSPGARFRRYGRGR
mmetsp:Transcript_73324/g.203423  ORF Transcript_73324/g.203423 Transcript_73324/m.203423 type:complete len:385 (-) Transcript_73324:79-1233(-)